MNKVQGFVSRQMGNFEHLRNNEYDTAIKRLRCAKEEDFNSFRNDALNDIMRTVNTSIEGPPVFACKFAPGNSGYEHLLALANEDGKICIHNTELNANAEDQPVRIVANAHHNAIFDLAWMFGQMKLVSVSGDHTARLFDVTPTALIEERIFHGHFRSVKTVACRKDDPAVFATGSRDGAIFVWDTRATQSHMYVQKPDRIIANPHSVNDTPTRLKFRKRFGNSFTHVPGTESVTGLVFQDDVTLISCGAGDGHIKIWDIRYYSHRKDPQPKYTIPYSGGMSHKGFSNLIVDNSSLKLYASCMDHTIYCYNIATYQPEPIMTYTGHQQSTFYVKSCLSPDGQYLVSGSGDNHCYIWNTSRKHPIVRLEGHTHEVTCVAWCNKVDDMKIATCSDDLRHKIWRIHNRDTDNETDIDYKLNSRGLAHEMSSYKHEVNDDDNVSYNYCSDLTIQQTVINVNTASTPTGSKKRSAATLDRTPHSEKKRAIVCERCQMLTPGSVESLLVNCENCMFIRRTSDNSSAKRNGQNADLSSPETDGCSSAKRMQQGGVRSRLFVATTPLQDTTCTSNITRSYEIGDGPLATILEENISPELQTNMRILSSNSSGTTHELLLENLPNFVIDGQAPHLKNFSPQKKRDKDWLTKIRIEQSLKNQMEELSRPSSPKQLKLIASPKLLHNTGKKQQKKTTSTVATSSNSNMTTTVTNNNNNSINSSVNSPLLKYFRSTNNNNKATTARSVYAENASSHCNNNITATCTTNDTANSTNDFVTDV